MDLWQIRLEALRLAVEGIGHFVPVEEVILRANEIEQYVKHGFISPEMRQIMQNVPAGENA